MTRRSTDMLVRFARSRAARLALAALLIVGGTAATSAPAAADDPPRTGAQPADAAQLDRRVARLIEDLGADQFTVRENAQAELQRLGPTAFDALDQARQHADVEVAMRVRYLLRIMAVDWSRPDDSPEIKGALKGYGDQNENERRNRIERLGAFAEGRGASALCRLARFEANPVLAKRAALLVLQQPPPAAPADRAALAKSIVDTVDSSRRTAAAWLRLYARTLEDPSSTVEAWQKFTLAELQAVRGASETTDREVVRELLRWQSDFLKRIERPNESLAAARRMLDLVEDTPTELGDLVGWYVDRQFWTLVQETAERHADDFDRSALLRYRLAESQLRRDRPDDAAKTADAAAAMQPDNASAHVELALDLRERGLVDWAEREFRQALKVLAPGDAEDIRARSRMAEMYFDYDRPLDAAKVWQELADKIEADVQLKARLGNRNLPFQSRMHYFYAQHFGAQKNHAKQQEHLEQGISADNTDADVLIALHRLPEATAERRELTRRQIELAAKQFQSQIESLNRAVDNIQPELRERYADALANAHNQYAWLVANTAGDLDEALRCGLRAVELRPKTSSYLDTLAHAYYAKGDYANAVKYQTLAVQREPNSRQIRRQLGVFQKALDAQRGAAPQGEKPAGASGGA